MASRAISTRWCLGSGLQDVCECVVVELAVGTTGQTIEIFIQMLKQDKGLKMALTCRTSASWDRG